MESIIRPRANCRHCFGNGVYLCVKEGASETYAFRCHCEAGQRDRRTKIPQYKQGHADLGFVWSEITRHYDWKKTPDETPKTQVQLDSFSEAPW